MNTHSVLTPLPQLYRVVHCSIFWWSGNVLQEVVDTASIGATLALARVIQRFRWCVLVAVPYIDETVITGRVAAQSIPMALNFSNLHRSHLGVPVRDLPSR